MKWNQTFLGIFYPLDPRPQDVDLRDIAHSLSMKCRFDGHCRELYSVAQHSVLVARTVMKWGISLDAGKEGCNLIFRVALLHDAAEAYLPDLTPPVKSAWKEFEQIEQRVLQAIHTALGVVSNAEFDAAVKYCDDMLLATEARDLMGPPPKPWDNLPPPMVDKIDPWSSTKAEAIWSSEWHLHSKDKDWNS